MDDTSYLDSSGDKIQASINIATQFYHFHDVDISVPNGSDQTGF